MKVSHSGNPEWRFVNFVTCLRILEADNSGLPGGFKKLPGNTKRVVVFSCNFSGVIFFWGARTPLLGAGFEQKPTRTPSHCQGPVCEGVAYELLFVTLRIFFRTLSGALRVLPPYFECLFSRLCQENALSTTWLSMVDSFVRVRHDVQKTAGRLE